MAHKTCFLEAIKALIMKNIQHSRTRRESHLGIERLDARQVMSATAVNFEVQEVPVDISPESREFDGREMAVNIAHIAKSRAFEPGVHVPESPYHGALRLNHTVTEFIKAQAYPHDDGNDRSEGVKALEALLLRPEIEITGDAAFVTQSLNFDALADRAAPDFSPIILWRQVFSDGAASFGNFTLETTAVPLEIELLESPREIAATGSVIELHADNESDSSAPGAASLGSSTTLPLLPRTEIATTPLQRFEDAVDRLLTRSPRRNDSLPSEDPEGGLLTIDPLEKIESDDREDKSSDKKKISLNLNELEQIWTDLVQSMLPQSSRRMTPWQPKHQEEVVREVATIDDPEGGMVELFNAAGPLPADLPHRTNVQRLASRPTHLDTGVAFFTEFDLSTSPANANETREDRATRNSNNGRKAEAEAPQVETDFHNAALLAPLFFVGMVYSTSSEDGELPRPGMRRKAEQSQ